MRYALLRILDRIEALRTPEQQALLDRLMGKCQQAASVWTETFPLKNAPSQAKLIAGAEKWLQGVPAEVLQGFLELCPESTETETELVIVPKGIPVKKLLKLIDRNKIMPGQKKFNIVSPHLWDNVKSDSWKVGIADCRVEIPFDPSIHLLHPEAPEGQRLLRFSSTIVSVFEERFKEKGLTIMPQYGAVPTHATLLAQGKVVEKRFSTLFERSINNYSGRLPGARCDHLGAILGGVLRGLRESWKYRGVWSSALKW